MPQNLNFWLVRTSLIWAKNRIYSRGSPPWTIKWVKTVKNYHAPKFEFFTSPRGHRFGQNIDLMVMAPNHGGYPLGSILGPMGPIGAKKWVKTVKNYHAAKFEFFTSPRGHRFGQNIDLMVMAPNHGGEPLGSILGPMGSHWDHKMGQNGKKLPCPKIRIFDFSAGHRFGQNIDFMVMAPNHGGEPLGSILGPMGSHWGQKMGQIGKKLPCPKIRIFDYSTVIDLGKKSNLR